MAFKVFSVLLFVAFVALCVLLFVELPSSASSPSRSLFGAGIAPFIGIIVLVFVWSTCVLVEGVRYNRRLRSAGIDPVKTLGTNKNRNTGLAIFNSVIGSLFLFLFFFNLNTASMYSSTSSYGSSSFSYAPDFFTTYWPLFAAILFFSLAVKYGSDSASKPAGPADYLSADCHPDFVNIAEARGAASELETISRETRALLSRLYDGEWLDTGFQGMDSTALLYEYVASGRCETLEGEDGGYEMARKSLAALRGEGEPAAESDVRLVREAREAAIRDEERVSRAIFLLATDANDGDSIATISSFKARARAANEDAERFLEGC